MQVKGGLNLKKTLKLFSLVISLVIALSCMVIPASAQGEGYLTINKSGSGFVVDYCSTAATGEVNIPSTYTKNGETLPVKGVSDNAFQNCSAITKITVPASVTTVGKYAFADCGSLKSVEFSGSTCSFGKAVFNGCNSLTSVTLPTDITVISEEMFKSCSSLKSISIPSTVAAIGKEAFMNSGLTSVSLPSGIMSIGLNAFMSCGALEEISIYSNSYYKTVDGCLYTADGATLVQYPAGKTDASYSVLSGTERIGNGAFALCDYIETVSMPSSVTAIDAYAFYDCALLETAAIPDYVTAIGSMAFAKCPNLKTVIIPSEVTSYDNAFVGSGVESVVIENGVSVISPKAFKDCTSLCSVTIPSSVTTIGVGAFDGCSALTVLTVPESVTNIGNGAFLGCNDITLYVKNGSAAYDYAKANNIKTSTGEAPVVKVVSGISIQALPSKLVYKTGEKINTSGLVLLVNYSDGTSANVTSGFTVSPSSFSTEGIYNVTVTYSGKTVEFAVTVDNSAVVDPGEKTVVSVKIAKLPAKLQYNYKENIDPTGLVLTINYSDGTSEDITNGFMIKAATPLKPVGEHTVRVVYGEFFDTYTVTVKYAWWQWIIRILLLGIFWY